ncbi:MAG: RNA polymerase sigma factor RpoE [Oceanospirillaceae bacterium]|nr:RNA polymerase sigma factor RpoE [Oceanospirillaceae bacterium]
MPISRKSGKCVSNSSQKVTDQILVERVQAGDKSAFDLLVKRYQHKIIGLIGRYVQDQSEALDVAQETFIKAYKALDSFRGESAFYTWLYRIATNTAKNYLVTRNRRPPGTDIDIDDVLQAESESELRDIETPENNLYRDELFGVMASALEALPEELRVALTLRELEGMSYEDISEVMGCPIGTVRSRIFRARDAIDKELKPLLSS